MSMQYFLFSVQILLSISIHYIDSNSEYCSITCHGAKHTMCEYPEGGGPECLNFRRGLTPDQKNFVVHVHNELREMVSQGKGRPQAANMMRMIWCEEAAKIAQRWADQCSMLNDHSDFCRSLLKNKEPGGQIVAFAGKILIEDTYNFIRNTVMNWYHSNETHFKPESVNNYKFDPKTFAYTQIIWAKSDRLGCGISSGMLGDSWVHRFVCNYYPAGNVEGEPVYIEGEPCSQCPFARCSEDWKSLCQQQSATIWNRPDDGDGGSRVSSTTYGIVLVVFLIMKFYLN